MKNFFSPQASFVASRQLSRLGLAAAIALLGMSPAAQAASYYLQSGNPAGSNWNTTAQWWSQTSGGGTNPGAMVGNDFFLNGFTTRADLTNFGGASLNSNVAGGGITVQRTGIVLGTFTVNAQASIAVNSTTANYGFTVGNLGLGSTLNLRSPAAGSLSLNVTNLSGSGNLVIGGGSGGSGPSASSVVNLNIGDGLSFNGLVTPVIGTVSFAAETDLSLATLGLNGSSTFTVNLANDVTFAGVAGANYGSGFTSLAAGDYTAAQLNTVVGATVFSGGGTLTVVPEPGSLGLAACGGVVLLALRRRRGLLAMEIR